MNDVKFTDYKATPGEKHLGIATVLINNIIFLRYKIMTGKQGGHYPNIASYKITEYGTDSYMPAWIIESNMLKEKVHETILSNVHRILSQPQIVQGQPYAAPSFSLQDMPPLRPIEESLPF
jgi:hypothetical protein